MLTEICAEIRNYFLTHREEDIHSGTYVIEHGNIKSLPFLREGQYYRIVGSALNDGVHLYGTSDLRDETFKGSVWAMSVPPDFVELVEEITDWVDANKNVLNSPYTSESFGGYSYSKATGANGGALTWKDQFSTRLNGFRRISVL